MNTEVVNFLLVDDIHGTRDLLRNGVLAYRSEFRPQAEFVVHHAASAQQCQTMLKMQPIDFLYLDIELPDQNGVEMLGQLRKDYKDLWVVMVSGQSSPDNVKGAIKYGAKGFIVKPFTQGKINEAMNNYFSKR